MNLESQVQALNAFSSSLSKATSVKEKIRLADRIFSTLGECEKIVEQFIVAQMGGSENGNGRARQSYKQEDSSKGSAKHRQAHGKHFSGMKLADVARALLKEHGVMHGSDIESAAKSGGFKSVSENFQSYLAVALKRDGGFTNLGKNRWQLTEGGSDDDSAQSGRETAR